MGVLETFGGVFIWFAMAVLLVLAWRRSRTGRRRRPGSVGPAAAGAFYEMMGDDRRKAIEIILEEKTGYHDPEDADGNLPDLQGPRGARGAAARIRRAGLQSRQSGGRVDRP